MDQQSNINYHIFEDFGIVDEKSNSYIALRRVQWYKNDKEPDESKAKLELRKWTLQDNREIPMKGVTFLTEEGPHELVKTLIDKGYGHTSEIIQSLITRPELKMELENTINISSIQNNNDSSYQNARTMMDMIFRGE